jgi:tetratricopeptide (TPR) repeat protein
MELFDRANALHEAGKLDEAEEIYDQLLTQNHDNGGLLGTMGTLYLKKGKFGLAISLLERAAVRMGGQSDVLCNLAIAYKQSGQYPKALEIITKATKNKPNAAVLANAASFHINVNRPDEAIKYGRRALAIDPENADAHWGIATGLLEKGEWATAWDEHEYGFKTKPILRVDRGADLVPVWDGSPGKKVWIFGEQGLGDEIMFASMLPDVMKTNEVVFESHERLKTLFEKSFGVKCYGSREEKIIPWLEHEKPDARISVASLGKFYRRSAESFPGTPYLKAESAPRGKKFRVGISWTGGLKPGRIATRSVPLQWWGSILNNDCEFVSLQYTDNEADIEAAERQYGISITRAPEAKAHDYYETAKLVQSCDLVISVCTAVIHLAGALGVPCWVMVPNKPAWRYGVAGPMRWYRSVRLYRQPEGKADAWMSVVQRIGLDLNDLLDSQKQRAA